MKTSTPTNPLQRLLVPIAYLVAILVGVKYGYDFGEQISGRLLGIILAINGAVFCSFVVSMITDRVFRPRQTDHKER